MIWQSEPRFKPQALNPTTIAATATSFNMFMQCSSFIFVDEERESETDELAFGTEIETAGTQTNNSGCNEDELDNFHGRDSKWNSDVVFIVNPFLTTGHW